MNRRDAEGAEGLFQELRTRSADNRGLPPLPGVFNQISGDVIGAAIEVHRHLGPGFLETTYEKAMTVEMGLRGLSIQRQPEIPVVYKGTVVAESRLDFIVENVLVVELKAVESILPIHRAQVRAYLKAGDFRLGLMINFNVVTLREGIVRVINT